MAITVVGKDQTKVKRCTCKNCASILEYTMADTKTDYSTDYSGGRDHYRYLTCPSCSGRVHVSLY